MTRFCFWRFPTLNVMDSLYQPRPSREQYWWILQIWCRDGQVTNWSLQYVEKRKNYLCMEDRTSCSEYWYFWVWPSDPLEEIFFPYCSFGSRLIIYLKNYKLNAKYANHLKFTAYSVYLIFFLQQLFSSSVDNNDILIAEETNACKSFLYISFVRFTVCWYLKQKSNAVLLAALWCFLLIQIPVLLSRVWMAPTNIHQSHQENG